MLIDFLKKQISEEKSIFWTFSILILIPISAQNIELPEVTTVITGENVTAGSDALPSFENVIVIPQNSGKDTIELPEVTVSSNYIQKKIDNDFLM